MSEKETAFFIDGEAGPLEAVLHQGNSAGLFAEQKFIAVICHPHPLHGGTMDNKVVTTLMRVYRDMGIPTVRFNFRGVGRSAGSFDQGIGELRDLVSVCSWIHKSYPGTAVFLAGFSFGSAIAAQVSYQVSNLLHLTLVAPPVMRYSFDRENTFNVPLCVVQGDADERVDAQQVFQWIESLTSSVDIIRYAEAGHFFHGFLANLKVDLTQVIQRHIHSIAQA